MLKEYSDKIEEVKKEMAEKFTEQTNQQRIELAESLNELVRTGQITINKQEQTKET